MNPVDLVAKRKQIHESRLASLSYQYYQASMKLEELRKQIVAEEASIQECEMAKRDFGTYMAIEAAKDHEPEPKK